MNPSPRPTHPLTTPIRSALPQERFVQSIIYVTGAILTLWVTTTIVMLSTPLSTVEGEEVIWYTIRASGIAAYLLLTASMVWGVALSSKAVRSWVPAVVSLDLHNYLSWLSIGLTILHAGLLLFTPFYDYDLVTLVVPFTGPFMPIWVGLGIIATYVMILVSALFYVSKRIGYRVFHGFHLLAYLGFILALAHSIVTGTDTTSLMPLYFGTGLIVLFLTFFRIFRL